MSDWQPIDTAPPRRLGEQPEQVLLYGPGLQVTSGRAAKYGEHYLFAGVSWIAGNLAENGDVTHWMPLPAAPQTETR